MNWKQNFPGTGAVDHMRAQVIPALAVALGNNDAARVEHLSRTWDTNFDFNGVPGDVLERTDAKMSALRSHAKSGDWGLASESLEKMRDLWS